MFVKGIGLTLGLAVSIGLATAIADAGNGDTIDGDTVNGYDIAVSPSGELHVPTIDYRVEWPVLGTFSIAPADDVSASSDMHVVYTQPGSIEGYRRTGTWPDGTVILKELYVPQSRELTTGLAAYPSELVGWFLMVKDTQGRFPDNELWGDGWGWAFFDVNSPGATATTNYEADCVACHTPVRESDWIHDFAYPALSGPALP